MTVLSTKILSPAQKELLLNAGLGLVQYDAILIEALPFDWPVGYSNFIFSSANAARIVLANPLAKNEVLDPKNQLFCVGKKVAQLFTEKGGNVAEIAENASELGKNIAKRGKKATFLYPCGISRRDELPTILKNAKIENFELKTYETCLKPKEFEQNWAEILFFSPSAVISYTQANPRATFRAFCIGPTTAEEAKKHTDHVVIANRPSIESVIAKTAKTLLHDQERSIS